MLEIMHDAFLQTLKCTVHTRASYDTLESAWDFNVTVYLQERERERERDSFKRERETDRQRESERARTIAKEREREREAYFAQRGTERFQKGKVWNKAPASCRFTGFSLLCLLHPGFPQILRRWKQIYTRHFSSSQIILWL